MRVLVIVAVAVAALAAGTAGTLVIGRTAPADDEHTAKAAHRAFLANLAKGDRKAVGAALDRRFTWTDAEGRTLSRREALKSLPALAAANQGDVDVQTHFYGRVLSVRGRHDNGRFLRVFVKRRHGWKAFVLLETPIAASAGPASVEQAAGSGDCDNPCRTVPYAPRTPLEKDILAAWQQTKMLEWQPDATQWANFIADEFMIINNATIRTKPEREAIAKRQEASGQGTPGDPIISMEIQDFGDNAAVMFSKHFPVRGGKPYNNIRIWVLRDARWQLAISQQSQIKSATAMPAVASK